MGAGRIIAGTALSAILVAASFAASSLDAREAPRHTAPSLDRIALFGSFTPASADPKLAATLGRGGVDAENFQFTPAGSTVTVDDNVRVQVRSSKRRGGTGNVTVKAPGESDAPSSTNVSLAPIAYNLGVSVGWKRLSVSGDVSHIDMADQPGSQQRIDVGVSYTGKRASATVKAGKSKPLDPRQQLMGDVPGYSLDVGGSYSLTRNLDITAGVRYKSDRERLPQLDDNARRDSQSVYIGTSFRF